MNSPVGSGPPSQYTGADLTNAAHDYADDHDGQEITLVVNTNSDTGATNPPKPLPLRSSVDPAALHESEADPSDEDSTGNLKVRHHFRGH